MTIGISTFDLEDVNFQVQLSSLLKNSIEPDFIILHYNGKVNTLFKYYRFLKKTIKQYRTKSLSQILNRFKKVSGSATRNYSLTENEKKSVALFLQKVKIIKVKGINDRSTIDTIRKLGNTIIICNSGILKERVLSLPNAVFLNIHASKLPQYRGMNNIEWALFEGSDIYVTVHKISRGIDEGDILYQERIDVSHESLERIAEYREYCFFKSNEVIATAINKYLKNEIDFVEQKNKRVPILQYYTMHPILKKRLQQKLSK